MIQCPNCSATYGCNCQTKIASDGAKVCAQCVQQYEMTVASKKGVSPPIDNNQNTAPIIQSVTYTHNYN